MFEHATIRWMIVLMAIGLVLFAGKLLMDENGHLVIFRPAPDIEAIESTQALLESDSLMKVNLYRKQQAAVTIDVEEHKEPVYPTGKDIKTWIHAVGVTVDTLKEKYNDRK